LNRTWKCAVGLALAIALVCAPVLAGPQEDVRSAARAAVAADAEQQAGTAPGTPDTAAKETKAQAESAKPAETKDAKDTKDPTALQGFYKDGFALRTADRKNELRLQGSVQLDSRFYGGDSVAPDSFDIRRARLDFNAKLYDYIAIRIQAALEDNPYIRNAFIDIGARETFHVRIGQMKVPFSSQWLTLDNQVDFTERGSAEPVYPFFDRGILIWGGLAKQKVYYNLGVYTGAGVDLDYTKGDIDDTKDVAARLFIQPFRGGTKALEGFYFAVAGTYGLSSVPTRRYETRGLMAANFESQIWRWRTEQVIGSDGRNTDQIAGDIDSRTRVGAEVTYKRGPFAISAEWARVDWDNVAIYHDFYTGAKRLKHELVMTRDGGTGNLSIWASYFLTGEEKALDNFGWRQPTPKNPFGPGLPGKGAWEVLARFSATETDSLMFDTAKVRGFTAADFPAAAPPTPGAGNSVTAQVLDGATKVLEASLGLNWTMNYNFRILCTYTYLWVPDYVAGKDGIVSGANSDLQDVAVKNTLVEKEQMIALRFIFRI
jgi:phosphate-selective porin OprO and OprP